MLEKLDGLLDRLTMYKLLLYFLIALEGAAIFFGAIHWLQYSPFQIAGSAIFLDVVCWVTNQFFSRVLRAPANGDSTHITALILALIVSPGFNPHNLAFMAAVAGLAIASKYLVAIGDKHIFNPAAFAVALTALAAHQSATWWVGNPNMMPFVIVGGFLLMRRIRRNAMVITFLATALAATALYSLLTHNGVGDALHNTIFSSALLFMGFVMLTEPLTSPSTKRYEIMYSVLTGLLFPPRVHIGSLYSTPELVLCIGNLFAYFVNPRIKLLPTLIKKTKITPDSADFVFDSKQKFTFSPGQYMEFTLPHEKTDLRGQRRYFTIASSPTEPQLRIGVKFYPNGSSFKKALLDVDKHTPLAVGSLGGDFVLPSDKSRKIVLIAGGIGITPYRSMIKYMIDTNERRPVTLLYSANTADDIAYTDVFEQARKQLGVRVFYNLTKSGTPIPDSRYRAGMITPELLQAEVPDYRDSTYYVSGPHNMVVGIENALKKSGVSRRNIKTDFFSGYA